MESIAELWKKFHQTGASEWRDELIVHYLFLVKFVVGRLGSTLPSHIKLDDLYSSGVTGLIRAVEKYDVERNAKFESYAMLLIKGAIIDELRELDWVPRSIHQKANQISNAQNDLQQELGRTPTDIELSEHLGVSEDDFGNLLTRIRPAIMLPLNAERADDEQIALAEKIPDESALTGLEVAHRNESAAILKGVIQELPDQEREVLTLYYYEEMMLKEIGKIMGISESRVSQIHTKALLKMRRRLHNQMGDIAD